MTQANHNGSSGRSQITIIGAGIAGLTAAITAAEDGAAVRLVDSSETIGGRARSMDGPYKANLGPHAMYDGEFWKWLSEHGALPPYVSSRVTGLRLRLGGVLRRTVPFGALPGVLRMRGREAPVDQDFRSWAASHTDERTAEMLSAACGVYSFYHDPGELSAAFVWSRAVRLFLSAPPRVRYPVGGWSTLVASMERRARELGVAIETSTRVDELPSTPVIVATELAQARELLADESLSWRSGCTLCIDLGLRHRHGDPTVVSDMDQAGWIGRYSAANPTISPDGEELIQAQMPMRPSESAEQAALRLERLLDVGLEDWRDRTTWRRRQVLDGRSGALDMPGTSWRDRPAVDRGDGVFLAGDMVAAPGLLAEVSWASGVQAARLALDAAASTRPQLRRVA